LLKLTKVTNFRTMPDGENVWRYVYSFRDNARTWQTDGRTDRHRTTA